MTILQDSAIIHQIDTDQLVIRPFSRDLIQPASIDVRLGPTIKIAQYKGYRIHNLIDDGVFHLSQGVFVLAATLEWIEIPPSLAAVLAGKSSLARRGLVLESAGYVDPGWRGELTLELANLSPRPIPLTLGMKIGQLRFEMLYGTCERPYGTAGLGSHYQFSVGPVEAP